VPVDVSEGRIMGAVKKPIASYMRKRCRLRAPAASGDAAASIRTPPGESSGAAAPEVEPPAAPRRARAGP